MASRKKTPAPNQLGLVPPTTEGPLPSCPKSPVELDRADAALLESFDDYDDAPPAMLRLVDPPRPSPRVVVEAIDVDRFEVSRLRDNGTTVASVMWTRDELAELINRAAGALKM